MSSNTRQNLIQVRKYNSMGATDWSFDDLATTDTHPNKDGYRPVNYELLPWNFVDELSISVLTDVPKVKKLC